MSNDEALSAVENPPVLDALLAPWRKALGRDYRAYRNHVHRIFHLTRAFRRSSGDAEDRLIALAAVYHDLGLWTERSLDYLEPSAALAEGRLREEGWETAVPVVRAMILDHHKLRPAGRPRDLVEAFRQADWTDVTLGRLAFGLDPALYQALVREFPYEGFHLLLLKVGAKHTLRHPLNPLPMLRW